MQQHSLISLGQNGVALPDIHDVNDTLVDIARKRAMAGMEELARDAAKAEHHARMAAGFAVSAFNQQHPELAIVGSDPLTDLQKRKFTSFVRRRMRPLPVALIAQAAVEVAHSMAALEPGEASDAYLVAAGDNPTAQKVNAIAARAMVQWDEDN